MPWVIDVITHRDDPPGVPQLTYGRLVGMNEDLPTGARVGDRFGPVTAADRAGDLWQVPVAVVTSVGGPLAVAATVGPFRRFPDPAQPSVLASVPPVPVAASLLTLFERRPLRPRRQRIWSPSPN
jgi:hypothetical protein